MPKLLTAPIDLRPGEARPVLLMLAGSALLGAFSVFLSSASAAVFLQTFGAGALPFLYVGSALLVASAGVGYARLESRVPVRKLLPGTLILLLIAVIGLRVALLFQPATWPAVLLAGFGELAAAFVPLTFWAMAGRLFDVRQAKRLYGPVGAGEVAATALGGFAAPVVVALTGTANLLVLCAVALMGLIGIFLLVMRAFPASFAAEEQTAEQRRFKLAPPARVGLGSPYVVLMLLFASFATVTYYFVATAFLVQAQSEFPTQDALAGFLGVFTGVLSLVGFFGRTVIAGRVMGRFGIRTSLLLSPVAVAVTAALVVAAGVLPRVGPTLGFEALAAMAGYLFYANCANRICMETTWDSVYKPAFLVLYQPLPARNRLWLQTVVESIAAPLAQGVTGLSLLAYRLFLGYDPIGLSAASLVLATAWLVIAALTGRRYVHELLSAITRRSLDTGVDSRGAAGAAGLRVLEERLRGDQPDEVIYCLSVLDEANYPRIEQILLELMGHVFPTVRVEALRRIGRRRITAAAGRVREVLAGNPEPAVRAEALRALAAVDPEGSFEQLSDAIAQSEPVIRLAGLAGMLHSGGQREIAARQRVRELLVSRQEGDRVLAAQALGEAKLRDLQYAIGRLLRDDSLAVRRAALAAAGQLDLPTLWPLVVQRLVIPETARAAATALIVAGPTAMPFLVATFMAPNTERALRLTVVRLCGRIKDKDAEILLLRALDYPDAEVRHQALRAMDACDYRATGRLAAQIPELVAREIESGAWITAAQCDLLTTDLPAHVRDTFAAELAFVRERALLLLSFVYDSSPITRCASLILGGNAERRAYAMEILDNLIPHSIKTTLFPLLDDLPPEKRMAALAHAFPQKRLSPEDRLHALMGRSLQWCHSWSLACWLHAAGTLGLAGSQERLEAATESQSKLVAETATWALTSLSSQKAGATT